MRGAAVLLFLAACGYAEPERPAAEPRVVLAPAFPHLSFPRPVFVTHAGDGSGRLFVVEQAGRIRVFRDDAQAREAKVFLDIRETTMRDHNEEGLLGLAFDPGYERNGRFYIHVSRDGPRRSVIARYRVSDDDPDRAAPDSEEVLLEQRQPWGNHNGGMLAFGPDRYLYLSLGDGGSAGDPQNNGQNLGTLLGTICRIDVSSPGPYRIPDDNPFVDTPGARGEIWAYGLRNAWRFSFDRKTGDLWAGDVGQNALEEIDLVEKGGNYGWRAYEGTRVYDAEMAARVEAIPPVAEYGREHGISVTGGYVYRGAQPALRGRYFYADFGSRFLWSLRPGEEPEFHGRTRAMISSFGENEGGEVYACGFDGLIYRLEAR